MILCAQVLFSIPIDASVPDHIIFAVRQPKGPHWYENFGYAITDVNRKMYGNGGRLCRLELSTGKLTLLVDDPEGSVRDPQVHYNGQKILFSYRKGNSPYYHLYEINTDGSQLTALTDGEYDDIEPCYLPDGGIVFCSSRCKRFVPCWYVQVATLYRCEADGSHIRPLSSNIEQDNTPAVLPDGRILYTRWEYVDRSREHFHHLWVMNPDGSSQMNFFGNTQPGNVYLDAMPIPGSKWIVMSRSPKHGRQEHEGSITLINPEEGPDASQYQQVLNSNETFRDPYPLSDNLFLAAQENKIVLMDDKGDTKVLFQLSGDLARNGNWAHEPKPLIQRARESIIPARVNWIETTGQVVVMDIYQGRNMEGIKRGSIKKLLILENLPKPVNYTGSMDPISYGGSYTLNRILGTVPVEPDGSVNMIVPALRSLQLVALDENDLSVKRMLSFFTVMPGEKTTCAGCHEHRVQAIPVTTELTALHRPASNISPISGNPEIFDYPRDIQPIWDRHCLSCHDAKNYAGRILLTGDQGPMFTHSYFSLSARLQMADGRDLARGNYPPYRIGSAASYLLNKLQGAHYGVQVSPAELRRIKLWIDASATFPGTYAALASGMIGSYASLEYGTKPKIDFMSWPEIKAAKEVMDRRCSSCHAGESRLPSTPADNLGLRLHHLKYGQGEPRFWTPPWLMTDTNITSQPGSLPWMKKHADPRMQFSHNILYNLSYPEKSLQLLAPLSKASGGYGICGDVFQSLKDRDFQILLKGISITKSYLDSITRFNMPHFKPEPEYIREMIHYGIITKEEALKNPINPYETDRLYWESLWYKPSEQPNDISEMTSSN